MLRKHKLLGERSVTLGSVPLVLIKNERKTVSTLQRKCGLWSYLIVKTTSCLAASSPALNVIIFPEDRGRVGLNEGGFELS